MTSEVPEELKERMENDPFCKRLGIEFLLIKTGYGKAEVVLDEHLLNFLGTPHGGAIYALADAAAGAAVVPYADEPVLALETNMSYLGTAELGATLTATAEVAHETKRSLETQVEVTADDRKLATYRSRSVKLNGQIRPSKDQ